MNQQAHFDDLAKELAHGTLSRRKALRLLGGAVAGSVLASIPGVSLAAPNGGGGGGTGPKCKPLEAKCATNQDCCSRYCDKMGRICACPPEQTLCNRQCVTCPNGEIVNPATCKCEFNPNPECIGSRCGNFVQCSSGNPDCACITLATGGGLCIPGSTECGIVGQCGPNFECPEGSVCVVNTCCPDAPNQCAPLSLECESTTPATAAGFTPVIASSGPTFGSR
jgi:hypothetical protein